MDILDRLLKHDQWATDQLLDFCRRLDESQLDQQFDIGHRTIRATFEHMIANISFWIGLMEGQLTVPANESFEPKADDTSLAGLTALHQRSYPVFADLARRLQAAGRLDETYTDHYGVKKTLGGTYLMVILHNSEHRPEIQHMLARLGQTDIPEVDYGVVEYYELNT